MGSRVRQFSLYFAYHITVHVHGNKRLFQDREDYRFYLACLKRACERYRVKVVAHALMGTHVHLILQGDLSQIPLVFQSMGGSFARWYNKKYGLRGAVYASRYFSKPINTRSQYISTLAYVFNNPVAANIVKDPADYEWSSFRDLLAQQSELIDYSIVEMVCDVEMLCKLTRQSAIRKLDRKLEDAPPRVFSDGEVKAIIRGQVEEYGKQVLTSRSHDCLKEICSRLLGLGISRAQAARNTGLSEYKIKKLLI